VPHYRPMNFKLRHYQKLISVRHYCFLRGVLGNRSFDRKRDVHPEDDFRQAFREVNRLYVNLRDQRR
jgi:hypothetical protein